MLKIFCNFVNLFSVFFKECWNWFRPPPCFPSFPVFFKGFPNLKMAIISETTMLSTKHKKNKPQTKGKFSKAGSTSNKRKCDVLEDNLDDHPKKKNRMSPYLLFSGEVRPLINNEHPGLSLMQISKISRKRWKMLTQQEKNTYKEKSKAANDTMKKEQEEERIKTEKQKILKKLNKKEQRFCQEKTRLLKLANNSTFRTLHWWRTSC